ncbi:MAG: diguanylate cyclase [Anaerolineales bacterium]|nr:diguanylate cyclase [Anaerolineales bacterium]
MNGGPLPSARRQILLDPLTGIYSRLTLQSRFQEEINRARRYDETFSVLMIDLDHFKSINDAFGHQRGDAVLIELIQRVQDTVRDSDILFRYGGDEFVALLPRTSKQQALAMSDRLIVAASATPFGGNPPLTLSMSIGIASYPEDGDTPEMIFETADQRAYQAKQTGRGRAVHKDQPRSNEMLFAEVSRLVERDRGLKAGIEFVDRLAENKRSVLFISGPSGSGRSRFLREVGKIARIQGYEVLALRCRPALRGRAYGVLTEACLEAGLPVPSEEGQSFDRNLQAVIEERGRSGLVILGDDLHHADWSTVEIVYQLLNSSVISVEGLAYSLDSRSADRLGFLTQSIPRITVELYPLSLQGMGVWLRSALHWEAPQDFLSWLRAETGGLPAAIHDGLFYIVRRGILTWERENWTLAEDYDTLPLKAWLETQETTSVLNLPLPLTPFVGRDAEIRTAIELLGSTRLLTLTGIGGVGKTRLAIQVATEVASASGAGIGFPQGVHFVPLAAITAVDMLESAIADAIGFQFYGREGARQQLLNFLREKRMLLLMDNFEHLMGAIDLVVDILATAPDVKVMVTSRERLNVRGETVLELKGMEYPSGDGGDEIERYTAVQLFLHLARKSSPGFVLGDIERLYVARICQKVDGLPLGIELAAAWVPLLSCQEIAQEIEHNLDILGESLADVPDRHRSLRAVFDSSWGLLTAEEQMVLAKLSVFTGGFSREAAKQVSGASLPVIAGLSKKSLLRMIPTGPLPSARYELHEVLWQYAAEKLEQVPDVNRTVIQAHSDYYLNYLQEKGSLLNGAQQMDALVFISREFENIRLAWQSAVDARDFRAVQGALDSIYVYFYMRTLLQEAMDFFETTEKTIKCLSEENEDLKLTCAMIQTRLMYFYQHTGRYDQGRECFAHNHELIRSADLPSELAILLLRMGSIHEDIIEHPEAQMLFQESLQLYRALGDKCGITSVLNELGVVAYHRGEYAQSEVLLQEALDTARSIENRWWIGRALINLGNVECDLGKYAEAQAHYEESLVLSRELDDRSAASVALNNLGDIARVTGDLSQAAEYLEASARICQEVGDRLGMAISLENLGEVSYDQGDYAAAETYFQRALGLLQQVGVDPGTISLSYYMGLVATAKGDEKNAWQKFREALVFTSETQSIPFALQAIAAMLPLLSAKGHTRLLMEAFALILNHPGCMDETKLQARKLLEQRGDTIPVQILVEFEGERASAQYARVVQEILALS